MVFTLYSISPARAIQAQECEMKVQVKLCISKKIRGLLDRHIQHNVQVLKSQRDHGDDVAYSYASSHCASKSPGDMLNRFKTLTFDAFPFQQLAFNYQTFASEPASCHDL